MAWYNASWAKRQKVTLTGGSSGAQTDYQVKFTITYDSDMQADFDDLRFTKADGTTLLDAWLESKIDSTSAVVWVETDTPANTIEADIYIYYGNSGASSNWSGTDTFLTFLDKDSTTGWTLDNTTVTTVGDELRIYNPTSTVIGRAERHDISTPTTYALDYKFRTVSLASDDQGLVILYDGSLSNRKSQILCPIAASQDRWYYYSGAANYHGGAFTEGTSYIFSFVCDDSNNATGSDYYMMNTARTVLSSVTGKTNRAGTPSDVDSIFIGDGQSGSPLDFRMTWLMVRNNVTNPATYAFGDEESASVPLFMRHYRNMRL